MARKKVFLLLLPLLLFIAISAIGKSQDPQNLQKPQEIESKNAIGDTQEIGNGTVSTTFSIDSQGKPKKIGLVFSENAIPTLPQQDLRLILGLPSSVQKNSPFNHIGIDFPSMGHPPEGLFNIPHFDIHFYVISQQQREFIIGQNLDCGAMPTSDEVATGYVPGPPFACLPTEGLHWVDVQSPELNGQPLVSSFLYGYNKGKVTFMEVVLPISVLKTSMTTVVKTIKLPKVLPKPGFYPTEYQISFDSKKRQYVVVLQKFVKK